MCERGISTRSNLTNRETAISSLEFSQSLSTFEEELMFDPQTNGGLLFALPQGQVNAFVDRLRDAGITASRQIGTAADYAQGPHLVIV